MTTKPNFEIPSELIEPHLRYFMMVQLESLACNMVTPAEVRSMLDAVSYFVSCSSGIHARLSTSNEYDRLKNLSDEEMVNIAKKVYQ